MIGRIMRLLGSLRFTLFLIVSLSAVFLLGLWIPQKSLLNIDLYLQWRTKAPTVVSVLDALGLTNIYTSSLTLTLWALFFLNLSLVMWQRFKVVRKKIVFNIETLAEPAATTAYFYQRTIRCSRIEDFESIHQTLHKAAYSVYGTARNFVAVKNRFSPVATLLFHLSFFLLLLGGVVSVYTRFAGTADLAEGEFFNGGMSSYNPVPRLPKIGSMPAAQFTVTTITPEIKQGTPTGLRVTIEDSLGTRHVVEINRPYKTDNTYFVLQNLGVAPLIVLRDRQGRELDGAYVKLNVLNGKQDVFSLAGLGFTVDFYPDHIVQEGRNETKSEEIKNPLFRMHVQKSRSDVASVMVRPGELVGFGDYQLEIREMPLYVRFYVVKEQGLWIIYTGFAVAAIALTWRLVYYRREIAGSLRQENGSPVLHLAGKAEFYKELFEDEFLALTADLERSTSSNET